MVTKEDVMNVLKTVNDPELGMDIVTLEFIYNVDIKDDVVNIKMTFTSPMCPFIPNFTEEIKSKVKKLGFKDVNVDFDFSKPWEPSEKLKKKLGF